MRVWCKGQDFPGLAMSRSLGDKIAHNAGVISDPSVKTFCLENYSHFRYLIVNATDGLWDVMTENQVKC
jgi:hypothetical protein